MENSFFLPKGTEGRKKNIMVLHIQGLILIVVLIIMLSSSLGIIGRTVLSEVGYRSGILDPGAEQQAEDLRQLLLKRGMIIGNELIWNMHKALANDTRFAWDADGQHVFVKV